MSNHYETLGISKSATTDEIRTAYRQMALKYHPDKNPDNPEAEAKFKEAASAYDILSDESKRKEYDTYGRVGKKITYEDSGYIRWDYYDPFASHYRTQLGIDNHVSASITLEESVKGCTKEFKVAWNEDCSKCQGKGTKHGDKVTCSSCHGSGYIRNTQNYGAHRSVQTVSGCSKCNKTGKIADPANACKTCYGSGLVESTQTFSIAIPKGSNSGTRIRVVGHGLLREPKGPRGNLYVDVTVKPHQLFSIEDRDILLKYPVKLSQAIFGDTISIPTLYGPKQYKIKPGTQSGSAAVLSGFGLPIPNSSQKADMYIEFVVEIPSIVGDDSNLLNAILLNTINSIQTASSMPRTFSEIQKIEDYLTSLKGE